MHNIQQAGIWKAGSAYVGHRTSFNSNCYLYTVTNTYIYLSRWWHLSKLRTIFWSLALPFGQFVLVSLACSQNVLSVLGYSYNIAERGHVKVLDQLNPLPDIYILKSSIKYVINVIYLRPTPKLRTTNLKYQNIFASSNNFKGPCV